ncbi:MAG: hypothetical protein H6714_05105 [Myxococcales bacterium]|nr:hypothetical protein [Myxococcales bacterium]
MRQQLIALSKLSEVDNSARELDTELREIPLRIQQMQETVARLEALLDKEREKLKEAQNLKQQHQDEAQSAAEQLARSKAKMAKARNMKETDAVEREIENIRRTIREREQENDKLASAIAQVEASVMAHEAELEAVRVICREEEERGQKRIEELNIQREEVVAGRDQIAGQIDAALLRRYEQLRARLSGMGIAEVRHGICIACRMSLPSQQSIMLQRCETVEVCASCHRILLYKDALI